MKVELTHDIIALKVWEQLPERDKQLRLIRNSFMQRSADYAEDKGSFLGEKELNAWEKFFPLLNLDEAQQDYVDRSYQNVRRIAARKKRTNRILRLLVLTALIVAGFAGTQWYLAKQANAEAVKQQEKAERSTEQLIVAMRELANTEYRAKIDDAIDARDNDEFEEGQIFAKEAKKVIQKYVTQLTDKGLDADFINAFPAYIDNNGAKADSIVKVASRDSLVLPDYRKAFAQGQAAYQVKNYVLAYDLFVAARNILHTKTIDQNIDDVKDVGYKYYWNKAKDHLDAPTEADRKLANLNRKHAAKLKDVPDIRERLSENHRGVEQRE